MFLLDLLNEWKRCAGGGAVSAGATDSASAWRMQGSTTRRETTCRSGAAHVACARERDLYPKAACRREVGCCPAAQPDRSLRSAPARVARERRARHRRHACRATKVGIVSGCVIVHEGRGRSRNRWRDALPHPVRRPASAPARTAPAPARPTRSARAESRRTPSGSSVARRPYRP